MSHTRIGILSDTHLGGHQKLWDEIGVAFEGVDLILHSGDVSYPSVLDRCEEWAPVLVCLGNHDEGVQDDPRVKPMQLLDIEGFRIAMVHDMDPENAPIDELVHRFLYGERADIFICGDSHYERMDYRDGVLQINSGSAVLPHNYSQRLGTVAILDLEPGQLRAKIIKLGETPGLVNPGIEFYFDGTTVNIPAESAGRYMEYRPRAT
jgi:putative phosphoesterase